MKKDKKTAIFGFLYLANNDKLIFKSKTLKS
jgi:hypothetical protein